ncbi:MAG: hypothetical protein JWO67_7406 [Streptosporangiaceae bacterium]|nr:hypothetical protein [Streptosporangiaceae bacterium]
MSEDLVAFLRARLDEDEAIAKDAAMRRGPMWCVEEQPPVQWGDDPRDEFVLAGGKPIVESGSEYGGFLVVEHIARHDPARVLAAVEAKRGIMEQVFRYEAKIDGEWACCHSADEIRAGYCAETPVNEIGILRLLALPYAEHPDYRPEWKQ